MKFAILLLLFFIGLILGFFLYRTLIRSKYFAELIGGVVTLPETPDEVINRLDDATTCACDCADRCEAKAQISQDNAAKIRKRLS